MSHEGMPNGNGKEGKLERGPSQAAVFKAAEYKEAREEEMKKWEEKYRAVQMQIAGLEQDVQRGIEHMQKQTNPELIRLSKEVGKNTLASLEELKNEKEEIEQAIRERGGTPSDYTVQ